ADRGPTRHVDVNVRRVLRVGQQRVCVRATTRLHRGDGLGMRDVGNVEDADAAHAVLAYRIRHALSAAVEPAVEVLAGYDVAVAQAATTVPIASKTDLDLTGGSVEGVETGRRACGSCGRSPPSDRRSRRRRSETTARPGRRPACRPARAPW